MGEIAEMLIDREMGLGNDFSFLSFRRQNPKADFRTLIANTTYYSFIADIELSNINVNALLNDLEAIRKYLLANRIHANFRQYNLKDISYCANWKSSANLMIDFIKQVKFELKNKTNNTVSHAECKISILQNALKKIEIMRAYELRSKE